MQWSQLKQRVEATFAEPVRGRVELRTTRYHKAPDQMGRAWITFDGRELINMCTFTAQLAHWREATALRVASGCTDCQNPEHRDGYYLAHEQADATIKAKAIFARREFHGSLFEYLNLSVDRILSSGDPIIRGVGMLDRRVGKRRLSAMDVSAENPLVVRLHAIRLETERGR